MRLLLADKMDTQALEELKVLGVEIISKPELTKDTLPDALEVLQRARGFGFEPYAWSRSLTPNRANKLNIGYARTLEELASRSDIFTIHLPLKPQTRGVINRAVLEALPEGAMVINAAR